MNRKLYREILQSQLSDHNSIYYETTDEKLLFQYQSLFEDKFINELRSILINSTTRGSTSKRLPKYIKEQKIENIEDTKESEKFMIIQSWLSKQSSKLNWKIFLKRSGLITRFLIELEYLDSHVKIISIGDEEADKYWEGGYKTLVAQLTSDIYDKLLLMEFNDEHELNIRIKNMDKMKDPLE